jgi:hypothetical protein
LGAYVFELESLQHELTKLLQAFEGSQGKAQSLADLAAVELESERNNLISTFSAQVERLHAGLVDLLQSWNRGVSKERENFRMEARAVGVDL